MGFVRTRSAYGGHHVFDGQPRSTVVRNALVLGWALYDDRRLLVPDSAFRREGFDSADRGLLTVGAPSTTNANVESGNRLPNGRYVWIGHIHDHYGHFLLSVLPRLWTLPREDPEVRIVTAGPGDLASRLAIPHVRCILEALGVSDDRFVEVSDHTIIPEIEVPELLFCENSSVWQTMSGFCTGIAASIAGEQTREPDDRPLFLSKHKLRRGVKNIEQAELFAEIIANAGVRVVSPEEMTLAEQMDVWHRHSIVAAFEGSALHTGLFFTQKKVLTLCWNAFAPSNQHLIDTVGSHQSLYLNCSDHFSNQPHASAGFYATTRLLDPEAAARSTLKAIDYLRESRETMRMRTIRDTICPWVYADEPFGANLSRHKPARVSSLDSIWSSYKHDLVGEAAGAVSGRRSSSYQFHTSAEEGPSWTVDLEQRCLINEVRIFNRNDVARDRARHLVILSSDDGETWERQARRDSEDDFGGGTMPHPWRWWREVPFAARFIRLQLESFDFLHLDQVEVFGMPLTAGMPMVF